MWDAHCVLERRPGHVPAKSLLQIDERHIKGSDVQCTEFKIAHVGTRMKRGNGLLMSALIEALMTSQCSILRGKVRCLPATEGK